MLPYYLVQAVSKPSNATRTLIVTGFLSHHLVYLNVNVQIQGTDDVIVHQGFVNRRNATLGSTLLLGLQPGDVRWKRGLLPRRAVSRRARAASRRGLGRGCAITCAAILVGTWSQLAAAVGFTIAQVAAIATSRIELSCPLSFLELGFTDRLVVAPPVLSIDYCQSLLLGHADVVRLLLGSCEGRLEGETRDFQAVELFLQLGYAVFVSVVLSFLDLLRQALTILATKPVAKCILAVQLLGEFKLCPAALDELVDVVNLVGQGRLFRDIYPLGLADRLVAIPLRLFYQGHPLVCVENNVKSATQRVVGDRRKKGVHQPR